MQSALCSVQCAVYSVQCVVFRCSAVQVGAGKSKRVPLLPRDILHLGCHLPPPTGQGSSITNMLAAVQHAGHDGLHTEVRELNSQLLLQRSHLQSLLGQERLAALASLSSLFETITSNMK